jgi:hypothetical protein
VVDAAPPPAASAPRPDAAAAPPAASDPSAPRAREVVTIAASSGDGATTVEIRGAAPWRKGDVFATLMGVDPPRYLLRLSGIEHPFRPAVLELEAPLVDRVRTGLHDTPRGRELHVVLDLPTRAVEHGWEIDGDTLRVRLRPRTP